MFRAGLLLIIRRCYSVYIKLKDRKRSLSRKNDHNALWH